MLAEPDWLSPAATLWLRQRMSPSTEAAAHRRRALLAMGWPTSERVGQQLGFRVEPAQAAAALRSARRLLGVWSGAQRTFVHRVFQFDAEGGLRSDVELLLAAPPADGDVGGCRRALWLCGVREALVSPCPADVFISDPARVLALAYIEFGDAT